MTLLGLIEGMFWFVLFWYAAQVLGGGAGSPIECSGKNLSSRCRFKLWKCYGTGCAGSTLCLFLAPAESIPDMRRLELHKVIMITLISSSSVIVLLPVTIPQCLFPNTTYPVPKLPQMYNVHCIFAYLSRINCIVKPLELVLRVLGCWWKYKCYVWFT